MANDDQLRPTQDSRRFFMLPQAPADTGYYVYGNLLKRPARGAYQYAHPMMVTALMRVASEWQRIDDRRFGVGDISLAGGVKTPDHKTHRSGLEVDIRPLRKDGSEKPVNWRDGQYDREGTAKLIELFRRFANVKLVYFNGTGIPLVKKCKGHDDHLHVELKV